MTADFRLVAHAAERHLHELPPNCLGDCANDGCFAHAGRADEAQNRAAHILLELEHRQIFDNALLDLLQPVMILRQHLPRALQIQIVGRLLAPRQVENPLDIRPGHADFRCAGRHPGQALQLLVHALTCFVVQRRILGAFAKLLHIRRVGIAQFGLDGLHMLAQIIILLIFVNLFLDALLHLLFHAGQFNFAAQNGAEAFQTALNIEFFQNLLAILQLRQDICGNQVSNLLGVIHIPDGRNRLLADPLARAGIGIKIILRRAHQRRQLHFIRRRGHFRQVDASQQERVFLRHSGQFAARFTLHQHTQAVAGQIHHLPNIGDCADGAQIFRGRVWVIHILLRHEENLLVIHHRFLQGGDRLRAADVKVQHHMREYHQPPQRQHRHRQIGFLSGHSSSSSDTANQSVSCRVHARTAHPVRQRYSIHIPPRFDKRKNI